MRSAVEQSVCSGTTYARLKKLPFRIRPLKALHGGGVYFAVLVVGRFKSNEHVPLGAVVTNPGNITVLFDFRTEERIQRNRTVIFDLHRFGTGDIAYPDERRKYDNSQN